MLTPKNVVGIYTDASFDGVDVCVLRTDGLDLYGEPIVISRPYDPNLRAELSGLKKNEDFSDAQKLKALEEKITTHIISAVHELKELASRSYPDIDLIGLSGQTIYLNPDQKISITLANADTIAQEFKVPVIDRFVQSDLASGGKGGPLLASFYEAITKQMPKPVVVVALGGLTALTYIGGVGELMSFHVGAGTVLLDMWVQKHYGQEMDYDGLFGAKGQIDERLLNVLMRHPFLEKQPPKMADRNEFNKLLEQVEGSRPEDGAATLTAFIAKSLASAKMFLPSQPEQWILTGGGVQNPTLVLDIKKQMPNANIETDRIFGWPKNALSAQGYGFLAVRSLFGLPISYPATTGVSQPVSGGLMHLPNTDTESFSSHLIAK